MPRLLGWLNRFWFAPAPAERLAAVRILVGLFALVYLGQRFRSYGQIARSDEEVFEPTGITTLLSHPIAADHFQLVLVLTLAANVAFILGWRYRLSGPLFAGLFLWVLSYRNSWGMIYHTSNALALHVLVLGLTQAADAWSIDARSRPSFQMSWRYGYPIRLLCTITLGTYFLAGVAKVAGPLGLAWASGAALRGQLATDAMRKELQGGGAPEVVFFLFDHLWLFTALGVGTLVLELAALPLILAPRAARWWAVGAWLMHWGIFFIMDIQFWYHRSGVIYASFFHLDRLPCWVAARFPWPRRLPFRALTPAAESAGSSASINGRHAKHLEEAGDPTPRPANGLSSPDVASVEPAALAETPRHDVRGA
jgi:hypothetical protein